MSDVNYKEQMEDLVKELKSTQEKMVSDADTLLKSKEDAIVQEATKVMEASQKVEAKAKAIEEAEQKFEAALERMSAMNFEGGQKADEKLNEEYKSAFRTYARTGDDAELKALSEGVDPEGGYTVRPEVSSRIITRIFETSPIRQVANVETISSDSLEMLIDDEEFAVNRVAEKGSRAVTSNAELGLKTIALKEYYAEPKATQRLLDDAGLDIESWIARKVERDISRKENTDFINGAGVDGARGILSYAEWASAGVYERNKLERINSGSDGAFTVDGLIDLQNSLKEEYQANATWMIKRSSFGEIMKLKSASNYHFLGLQPTDRENNMFAGMSLLGKNVLFADDLAAADGSTAGLESAIYGDFGVGYTVVDHALGVRTLRDPFSSKPFVLFYTTKRTGGDVTSYDALKIQKLSA